MAARNLFSGQGMQLKRAPETNVVRLDAPKTPIQAPRLDGATKKVRPDGTIVYTSGGLNAQSPNVNAPNNQFANFGKKFLNTGNFAKEGLQAIQSAGFDPRDFRRQMGANPTKESMLELLLGGPSQGPTSNTMFSTLPSNAVPQPQVQSQNTPNLNQAGLAPVPQADPGAKFQPASPVGSQFDPFAGFDVELGKKGNVKSVNGVEIPVDQRKKPGAYNYFGIGPGNALQEGVNFDFQNIPDLAPLLESLRGFGQGAYRQGEDLTGMGKDQLFNTAQDLGSTMGSERAIQSQALNQLNRLQQMGIDPTLSANFQGDLADTLARRKQAVNERFTTGDIADQFGRERGLAIQNLASRGMTDSTTAQNTLSDLEFKLMRERANQLQGVEELTRQEQLGERTRLGEQATSFGGLRAGQAQTGSGALAQLLGISENVGSSLGSLGVNLQNIGLEGLTNQAQLSQQERDTLADMQLAALNTRLGARQGTLENLFGARQSKFDREMARQQMAAQQALVDRQTGFGSWLMDLGTAGVSAAVPVATKGAFGGFAK